MRNPDLLITIGAASVCAMHNKRNFCKVFSSCSKWKHGTMESACWPRLLANTRLTHNRPAMMPFGNRKIILEDLFSAVLSKLKKKYHPSGNQKFNNLGIFQA